MKISDEFFEGTSLISVYFNCKYGSSHRDFSTWSEARNYILTQCKDDENGYADVYVRIPTSEFGYIAKTFSCKAISESNLYYSTLGSIY